MEKHITITKEGLKNTEVKCENQKGWNGKVKK